MFRLRNKKDNFLVHTLIWRSVHSQLFRSFLLTLQAPNNASENYVCFAICCIYLVTLLTNVSVETNSVDLDQTAQKQYGLGLHCLN